MAGGNWGCRLTANLDVQGGTKAANSNSTELQGLQLPSKSARLRERTSHNYVNSSEIVEMNSNLNSRPPLDS